MVADKLWRGLVASLVEHWAPVGRPPLLLDATLGNASGRKVDGAGFFKLAPPRTGRRGRPRTSMGSPLKKGVASVGVPRQGCGTAGKVESCQIGIFLRSPSEPSPMGTPPRPPLARRPRRPRLLPGPGPHRALAPGPGDGGLDPVGRGAVPRGGEGGDRAGPGRGPALAGPAPAPHLIDASRPRSAARPRGKRGESPRPGRLDGARGRRPRVVALPASAPDAATTVVARSTAGTIAHGSQLRL